MYFNIFICNLIHSIDAEVDLSKTILEILPVLFQGSKHLNECHNLDLMPGDLFFQARIKINRH